MNDQKPDEPKVVGIRQTVTRIEMVAYRDPLTIFTQRLMWMAAETTDFLTKNPDVLTAYKETGCIIEIRIKPIPKIEPKEKQ